MSDAPASSEPTPPAGPATLPARPAGRGTLAATLVVAAISLALLASTAFMTRVAFFKSGDDDGFWHARVIDATLALPPLAALLLALAPCWWKRGLRSRAVLAFVAFPAWAIVLRAVDNVIINDLWWLVIGMQLQGIQPFGVTP
jgi:hypothetical protein